MAKFTIDLSDQPKADWTTRHERAWIREATRAINKEYVMLEASGVDLKKDYPLLYEERNRLIELGTGREYRGGIGLGLTYKTKAELKIQARELKRALNLFAGELPSAEEESKYQQAYESFSKNYDLSYTEYRELTEILGSIGDHILNNFGNSTDVVAAYEDARTAGKSSTDFMKALIDTNREAKAEGRTTDQMLTSLREKLEI